jgi:ABC-type polysaccharide/polyol phosphate export permease
MFSVARRIFQFRGLLVTLTQRELQARYRGSALGFFWSLVNPLLLTGVYTLVFGWILKSGRGFETTNPYALFLISGLFPWLWASTSLLEGTASLQANAGLIRKAVFPVELPPVVAVLANLVHFLFALPILGAALVVGRSLGYAVGGWGILLMPLVALLQIPMLAGAALGLAALNVLFKDMRDIVNNFMTLAFFLAPIIYSIQLIPHRFLRVLIHLNPFTPFTLAYQKTLFQGAAPEPLLWLTMFAVTAVFWGLGSWLFQRLRGTLVELA